MSNTVADRPIAATIYLTCLTAYGYLYAAVCWDSTGLEVPA